MEQHHSPQKIADETRNFFQKVYAWMSFALLISGATAFYVASSEQMIRAIFGNPILFFGLIILQLALVIGLVFLVKKISASLATFMFIFYSFITGLTLSVIFLIYTLASITQVFFITAGMFAAMSVYGFTTKKDLTGLGQMLIMALIGLIIASIVNIFWQNSMFDFILSVIGVLIFTGLTAYDTQKIKKNNIIGNDGTDEDRKEAIMGALTLYLDFINLFLHLLRLLGKRR